MSPIYKELLQINKKTDKGWGLKLLQDIHSSPHHMENCSEELVEQEKVARNGDDDTTEHKLPTSHLVLLWVAESNTWWNTCTMAE